MKKIQKTLITAIAFVLMCSASWAATYYIDGTNGNDANPGSQSAPWKTIAKANNTMEAGDTVYIKKGTYKETIRPRNSGKMENYITYKNFQNEIVTLKDVYYGIDLSYRDYINVDGIKVDGEQIGDSADVRTWVFLDGGSYNIVQNCNFNKCYGWAGIRIRDGAHNNKILNNRMEYCGSFVRDNGDMIQIENANKNLIAGNTASHSGHNILSLDGHNNVIRDNNFTNPWERILELRKYRGNGTWNLVEYNRLYGASPATDNPIPPGVKLLGEHQIVRYNMFYDNVAYAVQISPKSDMPEAHNHRVYNNVFYNNGKEAIKLWHNSSNASTSSIIYKNNIFYKNGSSQEVHINILGFDNNKLISNNIMRTSKGQNTINTKSYGLKNIEWYQNNYRGNFYNNVELSPQFIDEENRDFRLRSTSLLINAGSFLTKITSNSGSGTVIVVDDASYFMDGWGIVTGDKIQLEGQSVPLQIIKIDYSTNAITIDRNISWVKGQGVSLTYYGTAPDIGAYEFNGGKIVNIDAPKNLRIIQIQ